MPAVPRRSNDREVKDHYDRLLSRIYWWMLGGTEPALERSRAELGGAYEVMVCMGDTITHLGSIADVDHVLGTGARLLSPGGAFVLTFRDYVSSVRSSADRFILVRGDEDRILTCCLEYQPERVRVTDILHERHDGAWSMTASSYDKLRLSPWWVAERLAKRGLSVERDLGPTGMTRIVARRPRG